MKSSLLVFLNLTLFLTPVFAQSVVWPAENIQTLTTEWQGERTPDGRPKVSDDLLERLKQLSMEEVWGSLRRRVYPNQFINFSGTYQNGYCPAVSQNKRARALKSASDRPLVKETALPPRYSRFNGFEKSAVVLTFVLESYQPYCTPQADQNALWRSLLH